METQVHKARVEPGYTDFRLTRPEVCAAVFRWMNGAPPTAAEAKRLQVWVQDSRGDLPWQLTLRFDDEQRPDDDRTHE